MTRIQTIETDSPRIVRLGEGGFGTTYRLSAGPNRPVVVLKLMPHGGLRARLSARLERELGTIAALSHHDDMVTIAGWGRRDDRWYVAFEEAAGGSLARLGAPRSSGAASCDSACGWPRCSSSPTSSGCCTAT